MLCERGCSCVPRGSRAYSQVGSRSETCPLHNQTALRRGEKTDYCRACDGSGLLNIENPPIRCSYCRGKGTTSANKLVPRRATAIEIGGLEFEAAVWYAVAGRYLVKVERQADDGWRWRALIDGISMAPEEEFEPVYYSIEMAARKALAWIKANPWVGDER